MIKDSLRTYSSVAFRVINLAEQVHEKAQMDIDNYKLNQATKDDGYKILKVGDIINRLGIKHPSIFLPNFI